MQGAYVRNGNETSLSGTNTSRGTQADNKKSVINIGAWKHTRSDKITAIAAVAPSCPAQIYTTCPPCMSHQIEGREGILVW